MKQKMITLSSYNLFIKNKTMHTQAENKGLIYGFIAVSAFALTLPATRFVIAWLDPVFIGLGRAVIAAMIAGLILLITRQPLPHKKHLIPLLITAAGVVIGFPVLSAIAMQTVPASHGGIVIALIPLMTAIVGSLISNERPSSGFWISSIVGACIVAIYSLQQGDATIYRGDILLFLASLSAAIGYAVGGKLAHDLGGWQVICWALLVALPFILLPSIYFAPENWGDLPVSALIAFAYLALVSQLFGFFLWYHGLAIGGIARVSQTQLTQPFITLVASYLLLGEAIQPLTILFAIAVVTVLAINKHTIIKKSGNPTTEGNK